MATAAVAVAAIAGGAQSAWADEGDAGTGVDGVSVTCAQETYAWTGSATVTSGGDTIATGVDVPAQLGSTLVVIGTSADGLDPNNHAVALLVSVGGVAAVTGARVDDGGEIVVHGPAGDAATGPLTVMSATVVVNRCAEVAVVSAPAALPPTTTAPPAASSGATLPSTGTGPTWLVMVGASALGLGLVCRRTARSSRPGR